MLYGGIGGAVVIVGALAFFLMKDDEKGVQDATKVAEATAVTETPAVDSTSTPDTNVNEVVPEVAPVEAVPEKQPDPVPVEPEVTEPLSPIIAHDPVENPGMEDAAWEALQDAVRKAFIESVRPKARSEARAALTEAEVYAIPALINGLIGLDISQEKNLVDAGNIVLAIQSTSLDLIKIPLKLDILDLETNLDHNIKAVKSLFKYWEKYAGTDGIEKFKERFEKQKAAISTEPDEL